MSRQHGPPYSRCPAARSKATSFQDGNGGSDAISAPNPGYRFANVDATAIWIPETIAFQARKSRASDPACPISTKTGHDAPILCRAAPLGLPIAA